MQKAQKAEQRLRVDRDEWRLMAENLQTPAYADADDEEEDEGDRDDEGFHDAHDGDPTLNLMMRIQEKVLRDEVDGVPVLVHLTEKIQMEETTLSIPLSRYHVVKPTKSWYLLSPR